MIKTSDFDYQLPEELIAQSPLKNRCDSKMLVLDRYSGNYEAKTFKNFHEYINKGDCIVLNNTKVINARFFGIKEHTGAKLEILLVTPLDEEQKTWKCMIKPGKRVKSGVRIQLLPNKFSASSASFSDNGVFAEVKRKRLDASYEIIFNAPMEIIHSFYGHTPLPPYIKREDNISDLDRYQTVFAKKTGAVAAPTAGLHFSEKDFDLLKNKGVEITELTLHVGPGTFKPVEVDNPAEHIMHSELYSLTGKTADKINSAKKNGNKIIAVGTTSVRVLETCTDSQGFVHAANGETDIFLYPPAQPLVVDMLLTNFHLPKSTLLMLVATFADRQNVLNAYKYAVDNNFRFYSYGDCMLLK